MTKHELRLLAQSKGVRLINIRKSLFFLFPGEMRGIPVTKLSIQLLSNLPPPISQEVPANAVTLVVLSQEEHDAKVPELMNTPKPNDLPGLDNYPIVEEQLT